MGQADAHRFSTVDRFAVGGKLGRFGGADQPRQALHASVPGHDAQLDLGLSEGGVLGDDAVVRAHG